MRENIILFVKHKLVINYVVPAFHATTIRLFYLLKNVNQNIYYCEHYELHFVSVFLTSQQIQESFFFLDKSDSGVYVFAFVKESCIFSLSTSPRNKNLLNYHRGIRYFASK